MSTLHRPQRGLRCTRVGLLLAVAAATVLASQTAQAGPVSFRIEEDWEVVVGTPDPALHAPQIITAMSSTLELADVHAVFEINHTSLPYFTAGGLQLQVWSGDHLLSYKNSSNTGSLAIAGETVRFQQVMTLSTGKVTFEINNGSSTTWGGFGTSGILKASLDTNQVDLSNYSPQTSVDNSYVSFAKHCVQKLVLKEVRYYDKFGVLMHRDTTERVVHQLSN
jgi:hypothetical protein